MKDGLIYVNTKNEIDCLKYRVAVLRVPQGGSFTCNTGWQFYVSNSLVVLHKIESGCFTSNKVLQFYIQNSVTVSV